MAENLQLKLASEFVQFTDRNIFLTGKAGTGKTTFLHSLRKTCPKRIVVVAPTGVAAINAGGTTIHSFFQLPFGPYIPQGKVWQKDLGPQRSLKYKINAEKIKLIKGIDLLVIDEISMVRADTLDGIDEVLRRYRDRSKPFGGVQLLMIGDLHQLSPVVKDDDWQFLRDYYDNLYFFNSQALKQSAPVSIELKHIYRQNDDTFIQILNAVRENKITPDILERLNQRYIQNFSPSEDEGYITLSTHNYSANQINEDKLKALKTKSFTFEATVSGDFPEMMYPNAAELTFKEGAQVMFVKNDPSREKLFFNGKIGHITRIKDDLIFVKCPSDEEEIAVGKTEWKNIKYELNAAKEIEEKEVGSFMQYPLKLAWAITIHKSQGLTFEKAIIDANAAFAHGQVYVALSRCKTYEGMVLRSPINYNSVKTDGAVAHYTRSAEQNAPKEEHLQLSKASFQQNLLFELFDFLTLKINLFHLKKLAEDYHQVISVGFPEHIEKVKSEAEEKVYTVADKFKKQIQQFSQSPLLPEENEALQQRVKKASSYFLQELHSLKAFFDQIDFEADNKTVKKSFEEALEALEKTFFIQQKSLESASKGFNTLDYLKCKSNAEIDFTGYKTRKQPSVAAERKPNGIKHAELYQIIKKWRDALAEENGVSTYMILPHKVLTELCNKLPANFAELESIKGIGKTKSKQWGNEILSMIADYCEKQNISQTPLQLLVNTRKEKTDTKRVSFDLFKEGKKPEEIAHLRGFSLSTIEGHLAHYIASGELEISGLLPSEKINAIMDYLQQYRPLSLNDAKSGMGESYSFSEIKMVMKHLEFSNKTDENHI